MILLFLLIVTAYGSGTLFKKDPTDTVAILGQNITLNCTLANKEYIARNRYNLVWIFNKVEGFNSVDLVIREGGNDRYTVSSSGLTWTLHITNSEMNHSGYYYCYVYKLTTNTQRSDHSKSAKVTICSPFNTSVTPDHQQKTVGQSASFTCGTNPVPPFNVTYFWFRYINDSWSELPSGRFNLSESGNAVTISELTPSDNGTCYACKVYKSKSYYTMYSKRGYLMVNAQSNDIIETQGPSTVEYLPRDNHQPISPQPNDSAGAGSTPSPKPVTVNTKLDHDLKTPSIDSNFSLNFSIIAAVITVFLLLIVCFLCFFVFLGVRAKSKSKTTKEIRTNRKAEDKLREGETDFHGQISPAQDNSTLCSGEGLPETTLEPVVREVVSDVHQQTETNHDQDIVDEPLSTETDGSVGDGEKRNDKQNPPESVYAVVDKKRAKSETSGAIVTVEASWTVSRGGEDGSKLNTEIDTKEFTVTFEDLPAPGRVVDRQPSGQQPPRVIPYHLSKRRASTATRTQAGLEQTADLGEDGLVKDDPRQRNVEGLIYSDLDLSRGSARIINPEEETVYADIGNKKTVGKLREGCTDHAHADN